MGLRSWTQDQISEGGTVGWVVGMGVKLGIEGVSSLVFGFLIAEVLLRFTPAGAIQAAFGVEVRPALGLVVTVGLFTGYVGCTYTESLEN